MASVTYDKASRSCSWGPGSLKGLRLFEGNQPPVTTSWVVSNVVFVQAGDRRPGSYREFSRVPTMPSKPCRRAIWSSWWPSTLVWCGGSSAVVRQRWSRLSGPRP
jgi:hypothetical protein